MRERYGQPYEADFFNTLDDTLPTGQVSDRLTATITPRTGSTGDSSSGQPIIGRLRRLVDEHGRYCTR